MDTSDVPPLEEISKQNDDEDSDGWDEMEISGEQTTCLFCPLQFHTIAVALDHCRTEHDFDLLSLKNKYKMDCYSYIKMINYIRLQKPDPKVITQSNTALWEDDAYLKPGEMESWLMYDFDDLGTAPSTPHYAIDGKTPISHINLADLQRHIELLTYQLQEKDSQLKSVIESMEKMKEVTRTIVESGDACSNKSSVNVVSTLSLSGDSDYFGSYSHFSIHHDMLSDKIRTDSYRDAILKNSNLISNKVVLDVGCGTGILSMFCAKAGASKVFGIDQSEVIYKAMDIIRENKLEETIHLIKGRMEDTNLPVEQVDIIVSEWMGYFLLFEGMLDSFIYARDKYLKPDGLVLPNRCNMSIIGCSDTEKYDNLINFWDDVYGFSMKCMKSEVVTEAFVDTVNADKVITNPIVLKEIDLTKCDTNTCEFNSKFELVANRDGILTCLVGYFDIFFDLDNKVEFSTGPHETKTHWQQTVFYLKEVVSLKKDEVIEGSLTCTRLKKNVRGLSIKITLGQNTYHYKLD